MNDDNVINIISTCMNSNWLSCFKFVTTINKKLLIYVEDIKCAAFLWLCRYVTLYFVFQFISKSISRIKGFIIKRPHISILNEYMFSVTTGMNITNRWHAESINCFESRLFILKFLEITSNCKKSHFKYVDLLYPKVVHWTNDANSCPDYHISGATY